MTKTIRDWFASYNLLIFDEIDSTNDEARRLVEEGVAGDFIVWSKKQLKGKGRYGRQWISPEGNLYLSILLAQPIESSLAAQLSFVTAVAAGEALSSIVGADRIGYKWPNDVLLNGKKLAGILLESQSVASSTVLDFLVIGIGINIKNFPEGTDYPATSMQAEGAVSIINDQMLDIFMQHFCYWRKQWQERGFELIREMWLERAINRGQVITVNTPNERLSGVFETLQADGSLELKLAGGQVCKIASGEVYF